MVAPTVEIEPHRHMVEIDARWQPSSRAIAPIWAVPGPRDARIAAGPAARRSFILSLSALEGGDRDRAYPEPGRPATPVRGALGPCPSPGTRLRPRPTARAQRSRPRSPRRPRRPARSRQVTRKSGVCFSRNLELSETAVREWAKQAERDDGARSDCGRDERPGAREDCSAGRARRCCS